MNITIENINEVYNKLLVELEQYKGDLEATKEALKDRKLDYLTVKDFENDIIYDKREIERIEEELKQIESYADYINVKLTINNNQRK